MAAKKNKDSYTPSANVKTLLNEAITLKKNGKHTEAHQYLLSHLENVNQEDKISIYLAIHGMNIKSQPEIALEALDSIKMLSPKLTMPLLLKANYLESQRKVKELVSVLTEMMELEPTHKELVEASRILSRWGQQSLAIKAAKKGYFDSGEDLSIATYPLRVARQNADWDFAETITNKFIKVYREGRFSEVNETPRTHLLWCDDEDLNFKVINNFANKKFKNSVHEPLISIPDGDIFKRKIRVAYVSNDFRDHPTSYLAMGLLRHHNKQRFEIIIYDTSYDDGKVVRRQIFSKADMVKDISKLSDAQAASIIHKDKIDVLVDLNGLTEGTRLGIFAYRPAPVQISYLGFPGGTGLPFVDYIIADEYTLPKASEQYHTEAIIRIENTYQINDYIAQYLHPRPSLKLMGLPEGKPIIGMFNNINKVGREVWNTWMRIMQAVPDAVLWLLDPGELAKTNLMKVAKLSGIESDRFVWAKKVRVDDHLARISLCAIALDPWPYGGHTTTSDILFAGVPVVALEGHNFASRVSGGLLIAAGLKTLVAKNTDEYVKIASNLLMDKNLLINIRRHLHQNRRRHPLFDAIGRTKQIEGAYVHALDLASKKAKPVSFNIFNSARNKKGS